MYFPTRVNRARVSLFKTMASPKRVFAIITAALTFLTFARIVVCLVEAYVAVRTERMADEGLMRTCNDPMQEAAAAPDFRALCLRKRAERAAPIVLKAVLRAVTTAFSEFCEVFTFALARGAPRHVLDHGDRRARGQGAGGALRSKPQRSGA